MPSMANITVKNAAAADVVYVAKVPSAGDRSPAKWTLDAAHTIPGFRPVFTVVTRDNGPGTARNMEGTLKFPVITAINGVDTKVGVVPINFSAVLPQNIDSAQVIDSTVQGTNLFVSTLIRAVLADGYAPG